MHDNSDDEACSSEFTSPPCFAPDVPADYMGLAEATAEQKFASVRRWRKNERQRLIAKRLEMTTATRQGLSDRIADQIDRVIGNVVGLTVSAYWPLRGEPDLRSWMGRLIGRGAHCALPVVVEKARPLVFRRWKAGDPMERGVWNIPVPVNGPGVLPDIVIAPVVGFDQQCYRLGYGGGYFDRTLAAISKKPRVIGVGYATMNISTIYPQPHDIPMDMIVTDMATVTPLSA